MLAGYESSVDEVVSPPKSSQVGERTLYTSKVFGEHFRCLKCSATTLDVVVSPVRRIVYGLLGEGCSVLGWELGLRVYECTIEGARDDEGAVVVFIWP